MVYDNGIPFIPLSYNNRDLSIHREIVVDYDKGDIYIKNDRGKLKPVGISEIREEVIKVLEAIKGGVSDNFSTFNKIHQVIVFLENWKDDLYNGDINIMDVFATLDGIEYQEYAINNLFDKKVLKISGKGLVDTDFSNELLMKLNNVDANANNYSHPSQKQCVTDDINTVNYMTGDVWLTRNDLGLGNVEVGANNYKHPKEKVCRTNAVNSVNGKSGNVYLYNYDIGLSHILDMPTLTFKNHRTDGDKYLTPRSISNIMAEYPLYSAIRVIAGHEMYAGMNFQNSFILHFKDGTRILMDDIIDLAIGTFMISINSDFSITHYRIFENNIVEFKHPGFEKYSDRKFNYLGDCKGFLHAAIDTENNIVIWGMEEHSRVVSNLAEVPHYEVPIKIAGHHVYVAVLYASGRVGIYGKNTVIGSDAEYIPFIPHTMKCKDIAAGRDFISVIREDGTLDVYGKNTVDNGSIMDYIPRGNNYVKVAAGRNHSIALTDDGKIVSWGYGNGNICDIPGGASFIDIDIYGDTNIALSDTGVIYTWGVDTRKKIEPPKLIADIHPEDSIFELNIDDTWVQGTEFNVQLGTTYFYKVNKPGPFIPIEGTVSISDMVTVLNVNLDYVVGLIFISSTIGYTVKTYINNTWVYGNNHLVYKNDSYKYVASHPDYALIEDIVDISETGKTINLSFRKPKLEIIPNPVTAEVFINMNNNWIPLEDATVDVNTTYHIRATHPDFYDYSELITITNKDVHEIIELKPKPKIIINPVPTDALVEIFINDDWVKGNSISVDPARTYPIRVSKEGFNTMEFVLNMVTSDIEHNVNLVPIN